MVISILLLLIMVGVTQSASVTMADVDTTGCVFDLLYKRGLEFGKAPSEGRAQAPPFSLLPVVPHQFSTEQQCIDYCRGSGWCVATSNGGGNGAFCQFHTDINMLGIVNTDNYKCQEKGINYQCELESGMILNLDGIAFVILDLTYYGGSVNEIIIPSRILKFDEEDGVFCHVVKTDHDVFQNKPATIYGEYYGNVVGYPFMWTNPINMHIEPGPKMVNEITDGGPETYFYRRGVNNMASGFPITGIQKFQKVPELKTRHGAPFPNPQYYTYNFYRNEYLLQPECLLTDVDDLIDREAASGEDMFYVRGDDGGGKHKYMYGWVDNHDERTAIAWSGDKAQGTRFKVANFKLNEDTERRGGQHYDRVVIGYNNDNHEVGWLGRNQCNSDTESGRNGARLAPDGKKNPNEGIHCGVKNWNFVRQRELTAMPNEDSNRDYSENDGDSASMGGGAMLAVTTDFRGGRKLPITAAVTMMTNNPSRGEVCSTFIEMSLPLKNRHICTGHSHKSANGITLERVETAYDGKLYKIFADDAHTLELVCNRVADHFGTRHCLWKTSSTITNHQLFKPVNNYVSGAKSKPQPKNPNLKEYVAVYEKNAGVWSNIGYLGIDTINALEGHIDFTEDLKAASTGISISGGNLNFASFAVDVKDVKNGDRVKFTAFNKDPTALVDVTANLTVGDNDKYKWMVGGETQCPPGYYLHQLRCKGDELCSDYELGCVKTRERSCTLNATNTTVIDLGANKQDFVPCPDGMVVTGKDGDKVTCTQLDIKPQKPAGHKFPTLPTIGTIVKKDPRGDRTNPADHPSDANWFGTPIQAMTINKTDLHTWHYGTTCNRSPSGFDPAKMERDVGINQVSDAPHVCPSNKYIAFIQCQDGANCAAGINIFCVDAEEHCEVQGEEHRISGDTTSGTVPVCPTGMAAVGFGCTNANPSGADPCANFVIACKTLHFDPHYVPPDPVKPDDGKGTSKTIIVALSIGLPLIIVAAITCLFCIPDTKDNGATGALLGVARTEYDIVKSDYDSLRKRKRMILNIN